MSVTIVTACVNVGRTLREFKPCTFDYYRENLRAFAALGWSLHAFTSDDAAADCGSATRYPLNVSDIEEQPWFPDAMRHWSDPGWRTRHRWMSQYNAPELLLEHYSALTMMKVDLLARVAATLPDDAPVGFIDTSEWVRRYKPGNLDALKGFIVPGKITVHWTPYNWENRELNGMNWDSMVSALALKIEPPMMYLLGNYMLGLAGDVRRFAESYFDARDRLLAIDLGTEQSIITPMAYRAPDAFNLIRFPVMHEAMIGV